MNNTVRKAAAGDRGGLIRLWCDVFSDDPQLVRSFDALWPCEENAYVSGSDIIESALWDVECGTLACNGSHVPLRMIYAVATHPVFRGKGSAGALMEAVCTAERGSVVCCSPADAQLYDWYVRLGLCPFFSCDCGSLGAGSAINGSVEAMSPEEYVLRREQFLSGRIHDIPNKKALLWQQKIFETFGGGFFQVTASEISALALVCRDGRSLRVDELLCRPEQREPALQLLMQYFGADRSDWRAPAEGTGVPSDLLLSADSLPFDSGKSAPWLGFIFD